MMHYNIYQMTKKLIQHGDNHRNRLKDIFVVPIEMWLQNWLNTNMK